MQSQSSKPVPLRGTQSLVGVMSYVWKNPSLTAIELLWRWLAAVPLLWLAWHALAAPIASVPWNSVALETMTFFEPVRSVKVLAQQAALYGPAFRATAAWWVPAAFLVWGLASALGRTFTLRRAGGLVQSGWLLMFMYRLVRAIAFLGLLFVWGLGLRAVLHATITTPGRLGGEPNLVLFTAEAVGLTLAAFMLWSLVVWLFDLPPLLALTGARLSSAQRAHLRSKLIETNLVMGIVRVALFVLALTFSASPLPFQSRETQTYIDVWWVGVGIFYIVASDFFHVVRRVTYLRLLESVAGQTNATDASAS